MFIREKKNKSGSVSIQILSKENGRNVLLKTMGSATKRPEIEALKLQAQHYMDELKHQPSLLMTEQDEQIVKMIQTLSNSDVSMAGPELIFGRIYDWIGFNQIKNDLFRHLVLARLTFPLSKLKTVSYLERYQGVQLEISAIYRFLDQLEDKYKEQLEQISFMHTKRMLDNQIHIVFYDMTTLHFETEDEDDLRRTGFSKVGKHTHPQIYLGLLVGQQGYPIAYDIYEGKSYEGSTLIPFIERIRQKFNLHKPVVVADSGLLSKHNLIHLETLGYPYIIGARIKSENEQLKQAMLAYYPYNDNQIIELDKEGKRLIVHYSHERAYRDADNRRKGLERLEKRIRTGQLTKGHLNKRGYNKYLRLQGELSIEIDYEKFIQDKRWDGLKGFITNTTLPPKELLAHYGQLWQIERAFRISKTDLRIRPIYHRLEHRIRAHIALVFAAYSISKTLETVLKKEHSTLSLKRASEITQTMYQVDIMLPDLKQKQKVLLEMDKEQQELLAICQKYF
ncbi:IS1634 family transposase [Pelistega ratti]|uniref:IS1634 family transposase n=1 Tax=Pelistega ratti TaxID=2652177 RepID=UPI001357622A|nr:IS1634 family transposase [Pelistega ratti]